MSILNKKLFTIPQLIIVDVLIILLAVLGWWGYDKYQNRYVSQDDILAKANQAFSANNFEKAAQYYQSAEQKGKLDRNSSMNYGIASYNLKDYDQAIASYSSILGDDENDYQTYNNLGNVLRDQQDYRVAEESYLHALELKPDNLQTYVNMEGLYSYQNKTDQSITLLEGALEKISKDQDKLVLYQILTSLYQEKGETGKVKQASEKILELDPNNEEAKKYLGK